MMLNFLFRDRFSGFLPATFFALAVLVFAACSSSPDASVDVQTGRDVLAAMHAEHAPDWYRTMTFVQTTIQHRPDGTADTTLWYEAMDLPGRLRIDIGSPDSGNSWIFRNDSIYVFAGGSVVNAGPTLHPLLLLGFDVYHQDLEETASRMDTLGFDLDVVHTAEWQGRPAWVVGAAEGDLERNQFWIDQERRVFVRLIQKQGPLTQEILFNNYEPLAGGWVAPEVLFHVDSTLTLEEYYADMRADVSLPDGFFDPATAMTAPHWFSSDVE